MNLALRILLLAGALLTLVFILLRVRAAKILIRDSISWILLSLVLVALAAFPNVALFASRWFGIASPINFVYLVVIFILLIKQFAASLHLSLLDARVQRLTQRLALYEKEQADDENRVTFGETGK